MCSCIHTTIWMHHMNANNAQRKKTRWDLLKNAACCFEKILGATPNKTAVVRPPASHFTNYRINTNKTYGTLIGKQEWTYKRCSLVDSKIWTFNYSYQFCIDTGWNLENLPWAMDDWDGEIESKNTVLSARLKDNYDNILIKFVSRLVTVLHSVLLHLSLSGDAANITPLMNTFHKEIWDSGRPTSCPPLVLLVPLYIDCYLTPRRAFWMNWLR